jgi:chromate transport protein ChrA
MLFGTFANHWKLVIMGSRITDARTAGISYLVVSILPLGALAMLLTHNPESSLEHSFSVSELKPLVATLLFLGASSLAMGTLLLSRARKSKHLFLVGIFICGVAFTWNIIAPLFWVLPLLFHAKLAQEHDD